MEMIGIDVPQRIKQRRTVHLQPPDGTRLLLHAFRQHGVVQVPQFAYIAGEIEAVMGIGVVRTDAYPHQEMHHAGTAKEIEIGEGLLVADELDDRGLGRESKEGRPELGRSLPHLPAQPEHRVDVRDRVMDLPKCDSVSRRKRAQAIADAPIALDAGADNRRVQRGGRPHQIEDVRPGVPVRVGEEHRV